MNYIRWLGIGRLGRGGSTFQYWLLDGIIADLSVFKRALRGEEKDAFDSLMNKAREHASSCTVAPLLDPMDAVSYGSVTFLK